MVGAGRLALILVTACGHADRPAPAIAPTAVPADSTAYYLGTSQASGLDGTPFGPAQPSIVQREVWPGRRTIRETVLVQGKMVTTTLTQTDTPNVFSCTDENHSFTGTLTYEGAEPWAWTGWTYDITLADGGKIDGHATVGADSIDAEKFYSPPGRPRQVKIVDHVAQVDQAAFEAKRREVTGQ